MRRLILVTCLSAPGFAAAFEVNNGPVVIIDPPPPPYIPEPILPGSFEVYAFQDPVAPAAAAMRPMEPRLAPIPDLMLQGEPAIVTIEEEGVRLPDEQFSLP